LPFANFSACILDCSIPADLTSFVNLLPFTFASSIWYKDGMEPSDYKKAIDTAQAETRTLLEERAAIDERLSQLQKTIKSLFSLLEGTPEYEPMEMDPAAAGMLGIPISEAGITDAIRQLLNRDGAPLTPVQIRDRLQKEGFDINAYASGLAVIHNTLKRLERQKEIGIGKSANSITAFPLPKNFVPMNTPAEDWKRKK
jgi:hypothetical protein